MAKIDSAWWEGLDDVWKSVFRKSLELTGEATPEMLQKIAAATRLYVAQTAINSLKPLADLPLTHVDFGGCKNLKSTEGLPPTVRILTFHWTTMDDITWIDALPNLERVYCDKALQTKINRRIGANKKKKK